MLSHISRGQKLEVKVLTEPDPLCRLQGTLCPASSSFWCCQQSSASLALCLHCSNLCLLSRGVQSVCLCLNFSPGWPHFNLITSVKTLFPTLEHIFLEGTILPTTGFYCYIFTHLHFCFVWSAIQPISVSTISDITVFNPRSWILKIYFPCLYLTHSVFIFLNM